MLHVTFERHMPALERSLGVKATELLVQVRMAFGGRTQRNIRAISDSHAHTHHLCCTVTSCVLTR